MALEDLLTKLIASVDANTAALKGAKGGATSTTSTGKADKAEPKGEKVTFDQVKVAATKVMDQKGKPFAKKMITDVGGAKELAAVKPEKYPALFKAFEAALAATDEPDEVEEAEDEL